MRIDAHQHFWNYEPVEFDWIDGNMKKIQRDFLPADLYPLLQQNSIDGCVAVQCRQSETENDFLLQLAEKNEFIKGVVGWIDLQSPDLEQRLAHFSKHKRLRGFRHILQGEARRDLMLQPAFLHGVKLLHKYNFTYDILIYTDQMRFIPSFVSSFPEQRFVIDHLAKPVIREKKLNQWQSEMKRIAAYENVFCKLSGMVTEANWDTWKPEDLIPYVEVIVDAFGMKRTMFGSDWPVCLVAASYGRVVDVVRNYFSGFSTSEQDAIWGGNACSFYDLCK